MTPDPKSLRIPLLRLARRPVLLDNMAEPLEGLELVTSIDIQPAATLPGTCYALKMEDDAAAPDLPQGRIGVFCRERDGLAALHQVYLVQIRDERPRVHKLLKSDPEHNRKSSGLQDPSATPARLRQRRKSFMTPTPLHLPESRVSPIPDSAHAMIYLKSPEAGGPMRVVPSRDVLWMHPLVYIPPA